MSYVTITVHCSGPNCNQQRGEANHWFKYWIEDGKLTVAEFRPGDERVTGIMPICGERCAHNILGSWFERKSV